MICKVVIFPISDLELGRRGLVHDEGGAGVLLQGGHRPHVAHALLHCLFSLGMGMSELQNKVQIGLFSITVETVCRVTI